MPFPGFTAAAAAEATPLGHYRGAARAIAAGGIAPQQIYTVPCGKHDASGNFYWGTCDLGYDDPGGWGVDPNIGGYKPAQCIARCKRIKDPVKRADCLDIC
jgi:hypothetical protein